MTNPYTAPPTPASLRPRWARKRFVIPALGLALFLGTVIGSDGEDAQKPAAATPRPTVTVTATATTTETPAPEPATTVTATETVKVTRTVTAQANSASDSDDTSENSTVYYANCSEARAAGDTPLYAGDPGYDRHLDRDGDGVACE